MSGAVSFDAAGNCRATFVETDAAGNRREATFTAVGETAARIRAAADPVAKAREVLAEIQAAAAAPAPEPEKPAAKKKAPKKP